MNSKNPPPKKNGGLHFSSIPNLQHEALLEFQGNAENLQTRMVLKLDSGIFAVLFFLRRIRLEKSMSMELTRASGVKKVMYSCRNSMFVSKFRVAFLLNPGQFRLRNPDLTWCNADLTRCNSYIVGSATLHHFLRFWNSWHNEANEPDEPETVSATAAQTPFHTRRGSG